MSFGGQVVTFVKVTEDTSTRDRYNEPAQIRTRTDVPGCLFRPLAAREQPIVDVDKVTERWRCTAPPVAAVLAAVATDEVIVGGITYQIEGNVEVFPDFSGSPYKCTITCERQDL